MQTFKSILKRLNVNWDWKGAYLKMWACTLHTDVHIHQQKRQHAGFTLWGGHVGCAPGRERKENSCRK